MSDHDIIPPVISGVSDASQQRDRNRQKNKPKNKPKKPQETVHPRTEPMALEDQDITTSPDSDHLIDYEA
jgi:hypothetical protein